MLLLNLLLRVYDYVHNIVLLSGLATNISVTGIGGKKQVESFAFPHFPFGYWARQQSEKATVCLSEGSWCFQLHIKGHQGCNQDQRQ